MKKSERDHLNKVASLGCIACSIMGYQETPAQIHHILHGMGMGQRNSNYHVIPLCPVHHLQGDNAIHVSKINFERDFGTELDLLEMVRERVA